MSNVDFLYNSDTYDTHKMDTSSSDDDQAFFQENWPRIQTSQDKSVMQFSYIYLVYWLSCVE